jgi:dolichol-phosphate mannosyltransferase
VSHADIDIGICVPVLNERPAVEPLLADIARCLEGSRYTILLVDDGSKDGTVEYLEERARQDPRIVLLKHRKTGPGCRRGAASRAGLAWLLEHTSHALFTDVDADGANRPDEILKGADLLASTGADIVIASKYVPGADVTGRPFIRRAGSRAYSAALRTLMQWHVHDYSNSFRIYRRRAAEQLQRFEPMYETPVYLVEMLAVWMSNGLRIVEMPTTYRERSTGASKVVPRDFFIGALGALRVGMAYRTGHYRADSHGV